DYINKEKVMFSEKLACPDCNIAIEELSPRMFSFNSPFGACPTCNGLGFSREIDENLVIPNLDLSIDEGGIAPFANSNGQTYYYQLFRALAEEHGFDTKRPLKEAPKEFIKELLYGTDREIKFSFVSHF